MESNSMSPADIAAVVRPNAGYGYGGYGGCAMPVAMPYPYPAFGGGFGLGGCCGNGFGMDGSWVWIILLLALFGGLGNGFGGGFGGAGLFGLEAIYGSQQFTQLDNGIRAIQNGICDSTFALNNSVKDGFYGTQSAIQGVNTNLGNALCSTTYELASKIDANKFAAQECCCQTQRAIDGVNFNNAQNTCQIVNAIHAEGNATRDLITQNKIETLQSKLADKDRDILARDFQLSQLSQNSYLVNRLAPCPIPAYMVANPNCCYNPCSCANQFSQFV